MRRHQISIHALREEGDTVHSPSRGSVVVFLSTPSARRATCALWRSPLFQQISIHALREEGDVQQGTVCVNLFRISIHALREEGDPEDFYCWYPTPISIHALREEGDPTSAPFERCRTNFYPRPPRGGRLPVSVRTPSCQLISIHALREEGDWPQRCRQRSSSYFYPRPPRGGRRLNISFRDALREFLSTPSARRATRILQRKLPNDRRFLSTPSARRATTP